MTFADAVSFYYLSNKTTEEGVTLGETTVHTSFSNSK